MIFRTLILLLFVVQTLSACAQSVDVSPELIYPSAQWEHADETERWSASGLAAVETYADSVGSLAYMVVEDGLVIAEWGATNRREIVQSVRKSFLSALYGIYVEEGDIDLDATLEDLLIDDNPPSLTTAEKQATVRHLLKARSGVYHGSAASPRNMADNLPARGSHAPGTFWYYNNWDFNALGTIFEQQTGQGIYEALFERLAKPLQMQDFRVEDGHYQKEDVSDHRAYHIFMSARDMARLGLLFLRDGEWEGQQVISKAWIDESTATYSETDFREFGYGYMWWTRMPTPKSYAAMGGGGHLLLVIPEENLVIVHRVHMDGRRTPRWMQVYELVDLVLAAKE